MTLRDVTLPASARLTAAFDLKRMVSLGKIATAALAVGTCQAVLDYVVPYVNERIAFGEPIANRQAVALWWLTSPLNSRACALWCTALRPRRSRGLDCTRIAFLAHRNAIKYGMRIGTDGVQLLGGHGLPANIRGAVVSQPARLASLDGMLLA